MAKRDTVIFKELDKVFELEEQLTPDQYLQQLESLREQLDAQLLYSDANLRDTESEQKSLLSRFLRFT